jgi:hypothetical protein
MGMPVIVFTLGAQPSFKKWPVGSCALGGFPEPQVFAFAATDSDQPKSIAHDGDDRSGSPVYPDRGIQRGKTTNQQREHSKRQLPCLA